MTGAAALVLFAWTLSPTVGLVDSGELTVAAWALGVPHPPGFPLYVLLTSLITSLPFGSIALRANAASALCAAIATALIIPLTLRVLARHSDAAVQVTQAAPRPKRHKATAATQVPDTRDALSALAGGITAALLFATLRTMWSYATVAEVYALSAMLLILVWLLVWDASDRRMRIAALLFGISLGVHPVIAMSSLPPLALLVVRTQGRHFFVTRRCAQVAAFALAGTAVYLYLPFAAWRDPVLNWGNPLTLERFWAHVSGWQYRGSLELSLGSFVQALQRFAIVFFQQFGGSAVPVAMLLAAVGARTMVHSDRMAFRVLATWIGANVVVTAFMNAGWSGQSVAVTTTDEDIGAYYLPTFVACCIFAGAGTMALLRYASRRRSYTNVWVAAIAGVAGIAILQPLAGNWRLNNRRDDWVARRYVGDVLRSARPSGMILLRDWQLSSPMMYVLEAERERPDVVALDLSLMEGRWYSDAVAERYPDLFKPVQPELTVFRSRLHDWENDPSAVQRDASRRRAMSEAFENVVLAVVDTALRNRPVYITLEVASGRDGKGATLAQQLRARYQLVPRGLLFELQSGNRPVDLDDIDLQFESLRSMSTRFGPDHVISQHVVPVYRDMLVTRAVVLQSQARCAQAEIAASQALTLDPASHLAEAVLTQCHGGRN